MTITAAQVWAWMPSSDRSGQVNADAVMTRIVNAVEGLWLQQWSAAFARPVTISSSTGLVEKTNHGLTANTPVVFTGLDDAAPLQPFVTYYVRDVTADSFAVTATVDGSALTITSNGTAWMWSGTRPEYVDQALIMQAAALYNRRNILNGVVAGTDTMGPFRVGRFDPDIQRLLDPGGWAVA